jgi:hypothetical protein
MLAVETMTRIRNKALARLHCRRWYWRLREAGICVRCADLPVVDGGVLCSPCRAKKRKTGKALLGRPQGPLRAVRNGANGQALEPGVG